MEFKVARTDEISVEFFGPDDVMSVTFDEVIDVAAPFRVRMSVKAHTVWGSVKTVYVMRESSPSLLEFIGSFDVELVGDELLFVLPMAVKRTASSD